MEEGKSNRSTWKLGRIAELHPGNDGFVRRTTVEVASSSGKRKRLRRPLQKLFPLEVREVGGTGQVPARPEKLEDEKSISLFKNRRTNFLRKTDRGGRCRKFLSFS